MRTDRSVSNTVRVLYEKGKPMTKEDVWNFVGIGRSSDFANFSKMAKLKLIKKSGKMWECISMTKHGERK